MLQDSFKSQLNSMLDKILFYYAVFGVFFTLEGIWENDVPYAPYFMYYLDMKIFMINIGAVLLDILIILILILNKNLNKTFLRIVMIVLCGICIALLFKEFNRGTQFYYGEVRDKQGLPLLMNNFGVIGGFVFMGWMLVNAIMLLHGFVCMMILKRRALYGVFPM